MSRTKETDWNGVWEVFWRSFVYFPFTKDDLNAFNRYHHRHSPTARRQYLRSWFIPALIWLLVCTGIWYLGVRERGTPLRTFLDLLPLFSGVPMYLLCFPWIYRRSLRKTVAGMISEGKNRSLFSRRRLTISPEGITEVWSDFNSVACNGADSRRRRACLPLHERSCGDHRSAPSVRRNPAIRRVCRNGPGHDHVEGTSSAPIPYLEQEHPLLASLALLWRTSGMVANLRLHGRFVTCDFLIR